MKKISAVVLAAGKGKRMKSPLPKVLKEVCGQPLIYYLLKQFLKLKSLGQIIIVVGYKKDLVKKEIEAVCRNRFDGLLNKIEFVEQPQMLGTGDALKAALKKIKFSEVLITCGDNPLISSTTISSLLSNSRRKGLDCCVLTSLIKRKNQLGVILRDKNGNLQSIKEKVSTKKSAQKKEGKISEVNSGTYYFKKSGLLKHIKDLRQNKKKREYLLTDLIAILYKAGKKVEAYKVDDSSQVLGVNDFWELQLAEKIIRKRIIKELIEKGVEIINPELTVIQEPARIGANTIIYPFTFISKDVIIGRNCLLGPFLHLREGTRIKKNVHLGNFLEVNRSQLGQGVKAKHFGYLGDSLISEDVNIGAGTVVANYDGKNKHKTFIKKGTLIGSDTVLVAPLTIGEKAVTGAGSVVTKDVKKNQVVAGVPARPLRRKE